MRSRSTLPAALATLLLVVAACSAESGGQTAEVSAAESAESMTPSAAESTAESMAPEGETVTITGTSFNATELTVSAGDSITFVNDSALPHTVTEGEDGNATEGARFDEQINAGESVEITFDEAGDVNVTCLFHSNMNLVVHVE